MLWTNCSGLGIPEPCQMQCTTEAEISAYRFLGSFFKPNAPHGYSHVRSYLRAHGARATGGIDTTHAASRCFPPASLSTSATISSSSNCRSRMSASSNLDV
jgi:hypothetical protein